MAGLSCPFGRRLDLLTSAVDGCELYWVPAELSQREDRLHRIGTEHSVTVQHLALAGSLDAMMVHVLLKKQKVLDAV